MSFRFPLQLNLFLENAVTVVKQPGKLEFVSQISEKLDLTKGNYLIGVTNCICEPAGNPVIVLSNLVQTQPVDSHITSQPILTVFGKKSSNTVHWTPSAKGFASHKVLTTVTYKEAHKCQNFVLSLTIKNVV